MLWSDMDDAPRDGREILVARNNGCSWDYYTVWWSDTGDGYPWLSDGNAYAGDRFDMWCEIHEPYDIWET